MTKQQNKKKKDKMKKEKNKSMAMKAEKEKEKISEDDGVTALITRKVHELTMKDKYGGRVYNRRKLKKERTIKGRKISERKSIRWED